jgi:hypothetical protein
VEVALGYHISPVANRDAIRREGLLAKDPALSDVPMLHMVVDGVAAVYLITDREGAVTSVAVMVGALDLWEADLTGLDVEADPSATSPWCVRVRHDIAPERVRLVVESDSGRQIAALQRSLGIA